MEVGDGLKQAERRVLFPVLDLVHVSLVAADLARHLLIGDLLLYAQVCDHRSECLLSCFISAFQRCNGTTHSMIFVLLTIYNLSSITKVMSWWKMITTKGRLLHDFSLGFADGEIRISCVTLGADEQIAILIDRLNNKARLYASLDECRRLASQHQYELVWPE